MGCGDVARRHRRGHSWPELEGTERETAQPGYELCSLPPGSRGVPEGPISQIGRQVQRGTPGGPDPKGAGVPALLIPERQGPCPESSQAWGGPQKEVERACLGST